MDLPFILAEFLAVKAAKDRSGSPLYGGMLITRLANSFGVFQKCEVVMLNVEPQKPFFVLLYKLANIVVDHGFGNFGIPDDTPCQQVPSRGRQRGRAAGEDEPLVVPEEEEMPMDPYILSYGANTFCPAPSFSSYIPLRANLG